MQSLAARGIFSNFTNHKQTSIPTITTDNMKDCRHKAALRQRVATVMVMAICAITAEASDLAARIDSIIGDKRMTVGVAAECGNMHYARNDSVRFPLLSVFKTHVAMAMTARMQMDGISPDSVVHIDKSRLKPDTYSPLRDEHPDSDVDITIAELMRYSVAESDNNACDILIDMAGGIDYVDMYIRSLGVSGFSLSETEASMHADRQLCYANWSHPGAMLDVLKRAFAPGDTRFRLLREIMLATTTGPDKIPAGVTEGTQVAHKTGSSDRTGGIKAADNDAGVVMLPEGNCYIVVFIMDSAETDSTNAATIAAITSAVIAEAKACNAR